MILLPFDPNRNAVSEFLKILDDDGNVIPCRVDEFEEFMKDRSNKIVKQDRIFFGRYLVSTVFLGVDHGWGSTPKFFETMILDRKFRDLYCERYEKRSQALEGHNRIKKTARWLCIKDILNTTSVRFQLWLRNYFMNPVIKLGRKIGGFLFGSKSHQQGKQS